MFHYLDKYARDDAVVKIIFDHLRNFGLGVLVLAAASWKQKHAGDGLVAIWDYAMAALLGFIGFALLWMNNENLFHKLRNTKWSWWLRALFGAAYALAISELYRYLQAGRGAA